MKLLIFIIFLLLFAICQCFCQYEYTVKDTFTIEYRDFSCKYFTKKEMINVSFIDSYRKEGFLFAGSFFIFDSGNDYKKFHDNNPYTLTCSYYNFGCMDIAKIDYKIEINKQNKYGYIYYTFYLLREGFDFKRKEDGSMIVNKLYSEKEHFMTLRRKI